MYPNIDLMLQRAMQGRRRRGAGGQAPPLSKVGDTNGYVPPPLFGRANVISYLFAHILWLET